MSVLTTILAHWPGAILWCQGSFPWAHGGESESEVAQSSQTLRDPMDCSLQGSSVHGIFQAGVLEWGAIAFSRGSSQPRDRTQVSCIAGRCFTIWEWEYDDQFEDLHHFVEEGSPRCWLAAKLSQWRGSQCGEQRGAVEHEKWVPTTGLPETCAPEFRASRKLFLWSTISDRHSLK